MGKKCKRFSSFVMAMILCISACFPVSATSTTKVQEFDDGSRLETRICFNGSSELIEYNSDMEIESVATLTRSGDKNIAVLNNGQEIFTSIYNETTGELELYRRYSSTTSNANTLSDTDTLFWKTPEKTAPEANAYSFRVLEEYEFGTCFEFDWYKYDDGSHDLAISHRAVTAAPNRFTRECSSFLENARGADEDMIAVIIDLLGFLPVVGDLANLGHIAYTGAISGDSSATIADMLVTAALSIAGKICKPAQVIATMLDSLNVIKHFNRVHYAYNTVKAG